MGDSKVREDVGKLIRAARKSKKLSQEALAYRLGVEQSDVSRIELGKRKPSPAIARQFAKALDLPESAFFK